MMTRAAGAGGLCGCIVRWWLKSLACFVRVAAREWKSTMIIFLEYEVRKWQVFISAPSQWKERLWILQLAIGKKH